MLRAVGPRSATGRTRLLLGRPAATSGGANGGDEDPLLSSLSEQGEAQLTGDVTFSAGAGITLTQVGQDIEISVT